VFIIVITVMKLVAISSQCRTLATPHIIVVNARAGRGHTRAGRAPHRPGRVISVRATGTAASSSSSIDWMHRRAVRCAGGQGQRVVQRPCRSVFVSSRVSMCIQYRRRANARLLTPPTLRMYLSARTHQRIYLFI